MPISYSDNQKISRAYFLRLGAVLAILAIVWLGEILFNGKNEQLIEAQNFPVENNIQADATLAASLPLAQSVFLIPRNDIITPSRKWDIIEPEFTAQSIYAIDTNSGKVLLQKNPETQRPIASLSKLVTALVILEKAGLKDEIIVSKTAVETLGEAGGLIQDEKISIESLLYAMMLESSNDAAVALAEKFNGQFIGFMNGKVKNLGLKNTAFLDPSGLNPENVSTAKDLVKIMREVIKYPFLNYIMTTKETEISSFDGTNRRKLTNINKLLDKYPETFAGKTGYTDEAGECMIIVIKSPNGQGNIINVILASQDRMGEMEKLIEWEKEAFIW